MWGSYGPSQGPDPYVKNFDPEESPSGMIARSGSYSVKSRVIDDDGEVYAGEYFDLSGLSAPLNARSFYFSST